jgi:hypothetical protein
MWANQYLAYETLPDSLKEQIADLRATHSAGFAYGTGGYLEAVAGKSSMAVEPSADAYAVETHPLVIRHPRTGRPALYANSVYTTGVEGMDPAESAPLLARLTAHATHPNFTCRLRWEPGMLTIWDNNATQHFADQRLPRPTPRAVPHQRQRAPPRSPLRQGSDPGVTLMRRTGPRWLTRGRPTVRCGCGRRQGGRSPLATTTPSIMSAITAPRGRPVSRIDTTAPSGRRRIDRSMPTSRGGHRKLGPTSPRRRASRVRARAAAANSTVVTTSIRPPS